MELCFHVAFDMLYLHSSSYLVVHNFVHHLPNDQSDREIAQHIDAEDKHFERKHIPFSYCGSSPRAYMVVIVHQSLRRGGTQIAV